MTGDAIAMIERCAARQMDGYIQAPPTVAWLWIILPPPEYEDHFTAGQSVLISVKLG